MTRVFPLQKLIYIYFLIYNIYIYIVSWSRLWILFLVHVCQLEKRLQSLIDRVIQQYGDGRIEYISGDEDWNFNRNELSFVEYTVCIYCHFHESKQSIALMICKEVHSSVFTGVGLKVISAEEQVTSHKLESWLAYGVLMHYIKASTVTNFGDYQQQKINTRHLSAHICTDVRTDRPAPSVNKYC